MLNKCGIVVFVKEQSYSTHIICLTKITDGTLLLDS